MKKVKLMLLSLLAVMITFVSCTQADSPSHSEVWSQDGKDSVVKVHYVSDNGTGNDFIMNYLLFRALFSSGGYSSVYHYYVSHPAVDPGKYTTYKPEYSPSFKKNLLSSSTSASGSSGSSYSSPSRSSGSSGSYSSPSRSYTPTYSSPSRSYSSPSYSSPSRSTGSSYSSPSRGGRY